MLRRVFVDEMNRGGVQFVDRALAMRTTAAKVHRAGGDAKLIEMDALLAHADILLEVLMIEDKSTPAGYGFDVRAKDLKRAVEITSVYSRALPPVPEQRPGGWTAGKDGYEFRKPPAPPPPTAPEIGGALARDVMFTLGSMLEDSLRSASAEVSSYKKSAKTTARRPQAPAQSPQPGEQPVGSRRVFGSLEAKLAVSGSGTA